jgi:HemX protein
MSAMIITTFIFFYFALACYGAGAVLALAHGQWGGAVRLTWSRRAVWTGALSLVAVFVLRFVQWHLLPMSSGVDTLNLLVLLGTAIVFLLFFQPNRYSLMCFYAPIFALLMLVNGYLALRDLPVAPRELPTVFLAVHVGLAFLAFALFLVASVTSLAYIYQATRLKSKNMAGIFQRLPSLQQLDQTLYTLIQFGYPIFVFTLVIGVVWAYRDNASLSPTWWFSPKIFLALMMTLLFGFCFHARTHKLLRGPKLAYLIALGFAGILIIYLSLNLLHLTNYNFWEAG